MTEGSTKWPVVQIQFETQNFIDPLSDYDTANCEPNIASNESKVLLESQESSRNSHKGGKLHKTKQKAEVL